MVYFLTILILWTSLTCDSTAQFNLLLQVIYPTGNKSRNRKDNISIKLELLDMSYLSTGWKVNVNSNLFIFNILSAEQIFQQ